MEPLDIEDGVAVIDVDGITLVFAADEEAGTLIALAEIGESSPNAGERLASAMLMANYLFRATAGATLCQNPETGGYAIEQTLRIADLDPDSFTEKVDTLVNLAEKWRHVVNGLQVAEETAEAAREEMQSLSSGLGGFMQV